MPEGYRGSVIVDFDGTFAVDDAFDGLFAVNAGPEVMEIARMYREGETSLRECCDSVGKLLNISPLQVSEYAEKGIRIREGFDELLRVADKLRLEVVIASSGFDFYILPALKRAGFSGSVLCNHALVNDDGTASFSYPLDDGNCQRCTVCKGKLLKKIRSEKGDGHILVGVGDGWTDECMIGNVDILFARAYLLEKATSEGVEVTSFEDFRDVAKGIEKFVEGL